MKDKDKTQQQLIKELTNLRQRIAELETLGRKRNQFEEALRAEKDKAQQYLDIVEVILVVLNRKGEITLINKKGNQILGYKEGELLGKNWFTTCVPSRLRKKIKNGFLKLMAGEVTLTEFYENPILTKSGTERMMAWHNAVLKDAAGNIVGTLSSGEDITERKQSEDALRDSRHMLQTVLDAIPSAVFWKDRDSRYLGGNRTWLEATGLKSSEEVVGKSDYDLPWTKEQADAFREDDKRVMSSGIPESGIIEPYFRADGTHAWAMTNKVPLQDTKGNVIGILGTFEDITARRQAEEELRESEARFRTLFEAIPDTVLVHDDKGTILHINEIGAERLEWSAKDLVGRNLREIVTPENAASIADHVRETHKVGWSRFETTYVSRSGWRIMSEVYEHPIKFGKEKAVLSVARDITERKKADMALREKEETIRAFVETSQDWIWSIDLNGIHTYSNPAIEKILGYTPDELIGKSSMKLMHEDDKRTAETNLPQWIKKKSGWQNIILRWRHKNGSWRWLESNAVPMFDETGKLIGFRGVDRDITERKRAEELIKVRLRLMEFAATHSLAELLQRTLDEVCKLTDSSVGFYHFVEADQKTLSLQAWSTRTAKEFCKAAAEGMHYSIDEAGVWVDCIRERRPVIHNDYASLPHRKGMPEGHAAIVRELVVPIMRNDRFVAILGVGNKPQDYTDQDVQVVSYLADVAWEIAEHKRAEEALRDSEEKYRDLVENINDVLYTTDESGRITYISPRIESVGGYTISEIIDRHFSDFVYQEDLPEVLEKFQELIAGNLEPSVYRMVTKAGDVRWVRTSSRPFFEDDRIVGIRGVLTDITEHKQGEEALQRSYDQLQETFISAIHALASTVEMKDQYTAGHQPRVTQLACAIAEEMGFSEDRIEAIRMAGLIHDIGKIVVPAEILNKPGPLTEVQYEMIKMHSQAGYDILKRIAFPWPVARIVLQHHELMDGSGYPQGLSGEGILLEARILTVANVVEAMSSHRPYRPAYDIEETLSEISQNRGIKYDPAAVDACLRLFTERGFAFDPTLH